MMSNPLFHATLITAALLAAPALAVDAESCTTSPAALRARAAGAEPARAEKALRLVSVGEKLCAAGGRGEAAKKFAAAAKLLDTGAVALTREGSSAP
jgi:hypothetical protein